MARHVIRDIHPMNDLTFLRIKSAYFEILVAPDEDFTLIVLQQDKDMNEDQG